MIKFNFTYDGTSITRKEFENNVPKEWMTDLNEFGNYSYGYYDATSYEEEDEDEELDFTLPSKGLIKKN